ncbi:hypothetical protein F5Y11DRAFT_317988 [Daldinia sp. FL1419]|nr:hypothetical protein F5Y11DRAFT_317988 [Daldinia sp. FL1419]
MESLASGPEVRRSLRIANASRGKLRANSTIRQRDLRNNPRLPNTRLDVLHGASSREHLGRQAQGGPKRAKMTRRNLKLFNRMTDPDRVTYKRHLTVHSGDIDLIDEDDRSVKTYPANSPTFKTRVLVNGILDPANSQAPENLDEWQLRLDHRRSSASPTKSEFQDYVTATRTAPNQETMIYEMSKLLKDHKDLGYRKVFNQAFTDLPKAEGFNNGLSRPRPSFVEGLQLPEFEPSDLNKKFDGAVVVKNDDDSIALPHLAGEWQGPKQDAGKAEVKSAYDGAALVYGRNQALAYIDSPDSPGHAAVTSFAMSGNSVNFYTHHCVPLEHESGHEYHQYLLGSSNLTGSYEEFKEGRRRLRNLQEDARDESYALRDQIRKWWVREGRYIGEEEE